MGITVKVDIHAADIARNSVTSQLKTYANSRFYAAMYDYIPFRDGMLSSNVTVSEDGVHFLTPYAAKMYTGDQYNFRTDHHALACSHWDRPAWAAKSQKICKEIEDAYKLGNTYMQQSVEADRATIQKRKQQAENGGDLR